MTIEAINLRVQEILKMAGDPEVAHSMEDKLRADFIRYVAELPSPLAPKARAVLETERIRFERWCA